MFVPSAIKQVLAVAVTGSGSVSPGAFKKANSLLVFNGVTPGSDSPDYFLAGYISADDTVTIVSSGPASSTWRGSVIEFYPGFVKSASSGLLTIPNNFASGTVIIPAVVVAKTVVSYCGYYSSDNGVGDWEQNLPIVYLLNTTTIQGTTNLASTLSDRNCGYSHLEFR